MSDTDFDADDSPDFGKDSKDSRRKRILFPSGQEIRNITDPVALEKLMDQVSLDISFIRADLEFPRTDSDGNLIVEWDRRAKSALAIGLNAISHIERHMNWLKRNERKASNTEDDLVKLERQRLTVAQTEAAALLEKTKADVHIENLKTNRLREKYKLIRNLSWQRCFVDEAERLLPPEMWKMVRDAASVECQSRIERELDLDAINADDSNNS